MHAHCSHPASLCPSPALPQLCPCSQAGLPTSTWLHSEPALSGLCRAPVTSAWPQTSSS